MSEFSSETRDVQVAGRSIEAVLVDLFRHPALVLWRGWNWKSAVLSPLFRGCLFFLTNVSAGPEAASAALVTEFLFRAAFSGFYGAMTEAFRSTRPAWAATLTVMALLPLANHSIEFLIHWLRRTPVLLPSIATSVAFTSVSTAFNLFAMRRGALIVRGQRQSLLQDLVRMPALLLGFLWAVVDVVRNLLVHGTAVLCSSSRTARAVVREDLKDGNAPAEPGTRSY